MDDPEKLLEEITAAAEKQFDLSDDSFRNAYRRISMGETEGDVLWQYPYVPNAFMFTDGLWQLLTPRERALIALVASHNSWRDR
jgi:hypothetical protein